jgi:hypothetical protein
MVVESWMEGRICNLQGIHDMSKKKQEVDIMQKIFLGKK